MSEMTLPTNIKQIGSIGEGLRIYMEDYVCTYLFQYAEAAGYDERIALLVGRHMVIDGQQVLFIHGAIQGKHAEEKSGLLCFTDKTYEYAEATIVEYFEGMEVVGWMQSQPSYGVYLNQQYAAYHLREFPQGHQVMFVMDPLERVNAFYTFDAGRNALTEAKGYFIYYDKNKSMHEYMLKNKAEEFTTQPPSFIELTKMEHASGIPSPSSLLGFGDAPGESPEDIIHRHQSERVRKRGAAEQRRTTNLLVSLSAVLLIVCFVMGAGLIQNQGRIANMEDQLVQINTAYRNLISQYGTAPVFAAQQEPTPTAPVPTAPAQPQSAESTYSFELQPEDFNLAAETGSLAVTDPIDAVQPATETLAAQPVTEPGVTVSENEQALPYYEAYTIQPGDSLIAISVRFYGDKSMVDEILALNGIEDADHIVAGKTIALPKK